MIILAIETSAKAASCAVSRDGMLVAEFFTNTGFTHSETVMPMVSGMLECARIPVNDVDMFAAANGPGSFTGVRIGISAVKAMAMAQDKPCAGVSSLEALAYNLAAFSGTIAAVMDARRAQVYAAIFSGVDGEIRRETEDEAVAIDALGEKLKDFPPPYMLVGDGAELFFEKLDGKIERLMLAPPNLRFQRASSVCAATRRYAAQSSAYGSAETLAPVYLRMPQAERERLENLREVLASE